MVRDGGTGETIIGAHVVIGESGRGTATDFEGAFSFRVEEPGRYDLTVSYISYATRTVTGIDVGPGETVRLEIELQPGTMRMEEIVVTAQAHTTGEAGRLGIQRKALQVNDGISAEMMSRTGDSNAASALRRVTGVSLMNGRDLYIRGLGNRYSQIQLNDSPLPSTSATQKETPVDLLGSGVIDHITVQKTWTPDQPGEFAGGAVRIVTRDFPEEDRLSVGYSIGYDSHAIGNRRVGAAGSSTGWSGLGKGGRTLPSLLEKSRLAATNKSEAARQFHNNWSVGGRHAVLPSQKMELSWSRTFQPGMPAGVMAGLNYSYRQSVQPDEETRVIQSTNQATGQSILNGDYRSVEGRENARLSGWMNLFFKPGSRTRISLRNLFSHDSSDRSRIIRGSYINYPGEVLQTVSDLEQRTLYSGSLITETAWEDRMDSRLEMNLSFSLAQQERPDRQTTQYNSTPDNSFHIYFDDNGNSRFFSRQNDRNLSWRIDYNFTPAQFLTARTGLYWKLGRRDFSARRFEYQDFNGRFPAALRAASPEEALHPDLVGDGLLELVETTQSRDSYLGSQHLAAAYLSGEFRPAGSLVIDAGVRLESSLQSVTAPDKSGSDQEISRLRETDLLPAVNLTWSPGEKFTLRAGWSTTLARPEFREISEFRFQDYVGSRIIYGNPDLQQTRIRNYDLRLEAWPTPGELLAVSLFYKSFSDPVELFYRFTERTEVQYRNADHAFLYGLELEGRKQLLPSLQLVLNASRIFSETVVSRQDRYRVANVRRPMYGQSPWIVNTGLFYTPLNNLDLALNLHSYGPRVVTVGMNRHGDDEYEQTFHSLDAEITWRLGDWSLSLGAGNLLNSRTEYRQSGVVTGRFSPGKSVNAGVRYHF